MKNHILFLLPILALSACQNNKLTINITNPSDLDRSEVITIDLTNKNFSVDYGLAARSESDQIGVDLIDLDDDGFADQGLLLISLEANENRTYELVKDENQKIKKITQAEISVKNGGNWEGRKYLGGEFENITSLSVPASHTDHSFYIRYEGPGWESDKAAYRFYLDWRNGMDYFGKKTSEMVLQDVGQDGFDSYHEESDWGMDLLKVGKTLGLGSIGRYLNDSLYRFQSVDSVLCEITKDGFLESEITTNYYGWQTETEKTSLVSTLNIRGGSALTKHQISFTKPIEGFCTGLVISKGEEFIDKTVGDYRLLATFGSFSLNKDRMGLAIIVENNAVSQVFDGNGSHVVIFNPQNKITYYFMAAWEQDSSKIQSLEDFEALMESELIKLNQPLKIKFL